MLAPRPVGSIGRLALAASLALTAGCSDDSGGQARDGAADGRRIDGAQARDQRVAGEAAAGDGTHADGALVDGASFCPPKPPYGTVKGATIPPLSLLDCSGKRYSTHDLCGKKAAWIFVFRGS